MKETKLDFKNSKGQRLVGILYSPGEEGDYPIAIYVHGYRSTKESGKVKPIAEELVKKGICLFAFDLNGRGESEGKFEDITITQYIDDLKCAIDFISKRTDKIGVIGNSLGGLVSLREAVNDKRIAVLVELSPLSIFPHKATEEFSPERLKEWKEKGYTYTKSKRFGKMKINYTYIEDLMKYNDHSVYENISVPVLIIHGTSDNSISYEDSVKLAKLIDVNKLVILDGADHNYTKPEDFKKVVKETVEFVTKVLK